MNILLFIVKVLVGFNGLLDTYQVYESDFGSREVCFVADNDEEFLQSGEEQEG